ncbi:MAG: primase protein [Parcubacteria group bacterium GW2011_GWA2_43_11]|nr:MAG: primase protein [Parcubacteria group bacterium GW2011_GWC2_42_11]KKS85519.1 MAG: primase protein [Parcubacteria group bacterium GW2011_GWA2_43_11]
MSDQTQQIKERINIIDVIGQYVKLSKAGKNFKGLSPFGNEKTPSFFVSPDKGMYYDFSSGQGGDVFSFVQKMEGVDFKGALQILAEKAGIELHTESRQSRDTRDTLYAILEAATQFFETKLSEQTQAREYLQKRGLEEATMRSFRLGFASEDWQTLLTHLTKLGYHEREIEQAGLIKKGERGGYYDRFRSRIIFPIMDAAGRVVAFSGRIFGEAAKDDKNAKYLNSPETPLFDKSRILFGYNKAKQFIRKYDFSILVEGQMDLVMSHQSGYANTVASSGTSLTIDHLMLLDRLSKKLVMAYDADPAGVASSGRGASLALTRGMDVKVARVPIGKDPADCILEDANLWKEAVRNSKHVVDFYLDTALREAQEKKWDQRQLVLYARDTVLPYIQQVRSATDKAQFVHNYANVLGISEDAVWDELRQLDRTAPASEAPRAVYNPAQQAKQKNKEPFSRKTDLEETLAGIIFWQETCEPRLLDEKVLAKMRDDFNIPLDKILAMYSEQKDLLVMKAEVTYESVTTLPVEVRSLMNDLAKIYTTEELYVLTLAQRAAERDGDTKKKEELDIQAHELTKFKSTLE